MNVPATDDSRVAIVKILEEFVGELNQIDGDSGILPWHRRAKLSETLSTKTPMPSTVTGLHCYMHKLYMPRKGEQSTIYPHIRLGHNVDYGTLSETLNSWLHHYNHGMFYNMLQVEDSTEIGWPLYSTRAMDAGALADEISDHIGANVGLRWKVINTGTKVINKDKMVRALAVECSASIKWRCQAKLLKLYSRTMKSVRDYPNGIRLRYVKVKKSAVNMVEKSKMDKLRARQKEFLKSICSTTHDDILQLDYSKDPGKIPTLRQMIMDLKSKETNFPLFHCVDLDWRQEGFIFQHSPTVEEEASMTINVLLPLLQHLNPEAEVDSNFTTDEEFRCHSMVWNEAQQMIIDQLAPDETMHIAKEEELSGFVFELDGLRNLQERPAPDISNVHPYDDDSVSTLHTNDRTVLTTATKFQTATTDSNNTQPSSHFTPIIHDHQTVNSHSTDLTTESFQQLDSRITGLASRMIAHQNNNKNQFNAIMTSLQLLTNARPVSQPTSDSNIRGEDNSSHAGT